MSAQHTPGAWHVAPSNSGNLCVFGEIEHKQEGYSENCICIVTPLHAKTEIDQANARLIAAAPEMLEALEQIMPYVEGDTKVPWKSALAAIAKAKGTK